MVLLADSARRMQDVAALPLLTCISYALPLLGVGGCALLFDTYVLKFSTDVLYISPGTMGLIFSVSRLWDAISDPIAGYLCDITRSSLGRRRLWMLCSAVPLGLAFYCTFAPPGGGESSLASWMLGAILFFYTAVTAFKMPCNALGVELSERAPYHERSRLYGYKSLFDGIGSLFGVGMMAALMSREREGAASVRGVAAACGAGWGLLTACLIVASVALLREAPGRHIEARNPFSLFPVVLRCRHARLFTGVLILHDGCKATFANLAPYALQYVAELPPSYVPVAVAAYMVASVFAVPMWLRLGRRWGKLTAFRYSMLFNAVAYLPLGFAVYQPLIDATTDGQRLVLACLAAMCIGVGANARNNLGESVAGDIIDYDHAESGERKQGIFFSFWMLAQKTAGGCVTLFSGFLLDAAGFVPNQEQTYRCKVAITLAFVAMPLFGMSSAVWLFSHFELDEEAHNAVRKSIAAREGQAQGHAPEEVKQQMMMKPSPKVVGVEVGGRGVSGGGELL